MNADDRRVLGWVLAATALALVLRLVGLDGPGLSDAEAANALQALQVARGGARPALALTEPGYALWTGLLFWLAGPTDALARLAPALFGGLLPLAALPLRRHWGSGAVILLAFALALDPLLVTVARQAGGAALALTGLALALASLLAGRWLLAGMCAGVAVLGGPAAWVGLGAGLVGFLLARLPGDGQAAALPQPGPGFWPRIGAGLAAALLAGGTLFFTHPEGLSGLFASLPTAWAVPPAGALPVSVWLLSLLRLAALPVLLGGLAALSAWRGEGSPLARGLGLAALTALLFGVLLPGRGAAHLAWVVLPLWPLAARALAGFRLPQGEARLPALLQVAFTLVLLAFLLLNLSALASALADGGVNLTSRLITFAGALVLLAIVTFLTGWGWDERAGRAGLALGGLIVVAALSLASGWNAAGLRQRPLADPLRPAPPAQADLLAATVRDLALWNTSQPTGLDVWVAGVSSPALDWALRDQVVRRAAFVPPAAQPSIVITPLDSADPVLAAGYRGQDFAWTAEPAWGQWNPAAWLRWWLLGQTDRPAGPSLLLWAREDLFPAVPEPVSPAEQPGEPQPPE